MTILFLILGLGLLVLGAECLVRGASRLAAAAGVSALVIGLTIVAYGTSAPEMVVSVKASWLGQADIAVGNVVGSNIFNVLFILGLSAVLAPLVVHAQLVRVDVPIMIGVSVLAWVLGLDGKYSRWDGLLLLGGVVAYTVFAIRQGRREQPVIQQEFQAAYGPPPGKPSAKPSAKQVAGYLGLIVLGLALLILGARWFVEAAVQIARQLGVSELVIALTIVAAGTSMPEVATSIIATLRGERDIAIGNVVGSNIFNLLAILGVSSVLARDGLAVAPAVLSLDLPVMTAVAVACLPIFFSGHRIARWEGALFLGYYAAYTGYLVLATQKHDALPMYNSVMMWFVLPLTAVTLAVVMYRAVRAQGR
jgi:cation:H+ antiporter